MANYTGILSAGEKALRALGLAANLDAQTGFPAASCSRDVPTAYAGAPAGPGIISMAHWGSAATVNPFFCGLIFEKILVNPRARALGYILSDQVWAVEVWSTFSRLAQPLLGITIEGPGDVSVLGPSTLVFFPGQSQLYTVTLPAVGDTTIDNRITWSFTGLLGADLQVTGFRVTAFPFRPDWSEPYQESPGWLTEVLPGYNKAEQRRSLRTHPRYNLAYRVLTTNPLETASLEALLYGWQARQFGVPVWPETSLLLADVAPGGLALSVDTTDRPSFEQDGLVMVWSNFDTWEAFQIASVSSGSILLASQATKPWAAGARVVPLRRGRLMADQAVGRPANWLTAGTFAFSCEGA